MVQLTIRQHWFIYSWLDTEQATCHFANQWWPKVRTHMCVNRSLWVKTLWCLYASVIVSLLEEIMPFHLLRPKLSSQPIFTYCELHLWNNFQRNFNQNMICFSREMHFENVAWKMLANFFMPQCDINICYCSICFNKCWHMTKNL